MEDEHGNSGDNHFRAESLAELGRLADKYEALLIFDAMRTGVGLTGKMCAYGGGGQ